MSSREHVALKRKKLHSSIITRVGHAHDYIEEDCSVIRTECHFASKEENMGGSERTIALIYSEPNNITHTVRSKATQCHMNSKEERPAKSAPPTT